jgi:hypothetical protein
MEKLRSNWMYFHEILYDCIFQKSADKIQISLKSKGILVILDFKLSPYSECCMLSSGQFSGI